ncbi:PTS transporter subunit EIIC [Vagococcus lutrae]|uniref:PTS transporter subunit EIIC n=1 Tax=Vagococcus lutrae TaxID=81947 RepID=UPI000F89262A|nr:PTS transporter subunit EIIC [Vagococcus lutrae]RST93406.1 PTS lactose transporter subunit IIBC [Vagococcus lutrae]
MNAVIKQLEKMKPFFDRFTANTYVSAMRNGLIAPMYVLLFSSLFMMIGYIPNTWGFYWSDEIMSLILKPYDFTMGMFGLIITMTISKSLAEILNQKMPVGKKINVVATMVSAISVYLIMMADPIEGGISIEYLGSSGMLAGMIIAFIIPNIYKFAIKRNLTIKLPDEVPPNISETFASLIAYSLTIAFFWIFDIIFRELSGGMNVAEALISVLNPIFSMADSYFGLSLLFGATAFFQFLGLNGPDVVFPAVKPAMFMNLAANQDAYAAGLQPTHALTNSSYDMAIAMGGTGATLVLVLMFAFLAKSKANKAVGRAATIPVLFAVNEPLTFGAPLIMNPMFFIPFMLAPIANSILLKFFIDVLGMSGFIMEVPWTMPGILGLPLGTNLDPLSFVLVGVILLVDAVIYYPFFKVYDNERYQMEQEEKDNDNNDDNEISLTELKGRIGSVKKDLNVLVLCAGGGTSGLFANSLNKNKETIKETFDIDVNAQASHYGQHSSIIQDYDVIVLAPQVSSHYENLKEEAAQYSASVIKTSGKEYIEFTRDSDKAMRYILNIISEGEDKND